MSSYTAAPLLFLLTDTLDSCSCVAPVQGQHAGGGRDAQYGQGAGYGQGYGAGYGAGQSQGYSGGYGQYGGYGAAQNGPSSQSAGGFGKLA